MKLKRKEYRSLQLEQVLQELDRVSDSEFGAMANAVLSIVPSSAGRELHRFMEEWNYCNPYEYYLREAVICMRRVVRESYFRKVGLCDRLRGRKMITPDTVLKIRKVENEE